MKGEKKNCLDLKTNQSKRLESGKSFVRLDPSIQDSPNVSSFPEETKNSFSSFLLISLEIGLRGFVVSVLSISLFKLQQVCATPLPLVAGTTAQLNLTQTPETSIVPLTVDASIPLSHSIFLNRICLATLARPTMF